MLTNLKNIFMKHNEHSKDNHSNLNSDSIKSALNESGQDIKQFSSKVVEELSQYFEGKKDDISGMKCKCKNTIKENPFVAVASALAIGALVGMICKK